MEKKWWSTKMASIIHQRIESAREGTNPTVICRMPSGWAVMADTQFLSGYVILLADPVVPDLNALNLDDRARFLLDMAALGDALLIVTDAFRINYEILGNLDPALHAHIIPRYRNEPDEFRKGPAFFYEASYRASIPFNRERDLPLMERIAKIMDKLHAGD